MRLKDRINSDTLLEKLGINNIQILLQYNRLRCFGHAARNDDCINNITALEVDRHRRRGRPRTTWRDTINDDLKNCKVTRVNPTKRIEWRKKHGSCATHSKWNQYIK